MEESMEEREGHMGWMQVSVATAEDDVVSTAQGQNRKHGGQGSEHGGAMTPGAQGVSAGPQPILRQRKQGLRLEEESYGRKDESQE